MIFCDSTVASVQSIRCTSCDALISRLKITTVRSSWSAAYCAMFSAKAVLPMAGRAAMMMRSLFWKPFVMRFSSVKPVDTPVIVPLRSMSSLISLKASGTTCSMGRSVSALLRIVMS